MNLKFLCEQTCQLAIEVGTFIQNETSHFNKSSIEYKGKNNLVSYVDKTAERKLVDGLTNLLPEAGYITEEKTREEKGKTYTWIIDPLDGTTNFIHGIPCYCVSIALMQNNKIVLGVVYEINLKECFYSWENAEAYLNGKIIRVSELEKVEDSLFATGFPCINYSRMDEYISVFDYLMRHSHGVRRLGSAAVDLAYVACGRFEGFYEYGLNPWDVAAGAFLVQQAGGKVSDFSGNDNYIFGEEIIATGNAVYDEFLNIIKERFKQ